MTDAQKKLKFYYIDKVDPPYLAEEILAGSRSRTVGGRLRVLFGIRLEGALGTESLSPATKTTFGNLIKLAQGDAELARMLFTPLGKLKEYQYLADDRIIGYGVGGHKVTLKDASLAVVMADTMNRKGFVSNFVVDDKTKQTIGFIAYRVSATDKRVVDAVKLFKFRFEKTSTSFDSPMLIRELLKTYREVHWEAHKDNPAATRGYDLFIKRSKRDGFDVSRDEIEDNEVHYCIKSKTVK